jgi:hypothetical protein
LDHCPAAAGSVPVAAGFNIVVAGRIEYFILNMRYSQLFEADLGVV